MSRPDPLDALRAAWAAVQPPARGDALAEQDAATRAAVTWMREAWAALPAPAARAGAPHGLPAPSSAARLAAPRGWRARVTGRRARRLAAAAVLIALLGGPWLASRPPAPAPRPRLVEVADAGHLELRSGRVRLLLLTPTSSDRPH